jgi:purine-binding chemotaxis protein CheW
MAAAPRPVRQYVTFNLMGEEYALQIQNVREIIECEPVTAIPSMPPVVRGVMNLRGNVVPVIDLPVKFGLAPTALGAGTYIVVVDLTWGGEAVRLGLLTRDLGQVVDVSDDQIKQVPDFGTRIQSEYLRGIGQVGGRFVLFLNVERLLSPSELLRITSLDSPLDSAASEMATGGEGSGEVLGE